MVVAMAQNIPDLLTVSLEEKLDQEINTEERIIQKEIDPAHWHCQTDHQHNSTTNLQCTTTGLLPVLRCTLYISSMTLVMVSTSEHLPCTFQFSMWNWVTS